MLRLGVSAADADPGDALESGGTVPVAPAALLAEWMAQVSGVSGASGGDLLRPRLVRCADGRVLPLPIGRWAGAPDDGDETVLGRCTGPVLDLGCGPGRLTAALHERGVDVLGVELLAEVPVLARAAGAAVLVSDLFALHPGARRWRTVLLIDGNVGIGGNVPRVLKHASHLLADDGQVLVEVHPGPVPPDGPVRLEGLGVISEWFAWGLVDAAGLRHAAEGTDLACTAEWSSGDRHFLVLRRRGDVTSASLGTVPHSGALGHPTRGTPGPVTAHLSPARAAGRGDRLTDSATDRTTEPPDDPRTEGVRAP